MNCNACEFLSTGCQIFSASVWREHGGAGREETSPSRLRSLPLGAVGVGGGLTRGVGVLWPTQWQRVQALSPVSLCYPLDFSGAIRAWASFCPWEGGSRSGCKQSFLSRVLDCFGLSSSALILRQTVMPVRPLQCLL